ncbi:MAG: hypothetical protein ABIF09_16285, partial [Gemmatimonadota bacterium]
VLALLVFQVGLLATAGMVLLAQQNLLRAELTVRGILAADLVADSLEEEGEVGSGRRPYIWGEVSWAPASDEIGGLTVVAFSTLLGDTLVEFRALIPQEDSLNAPDGFSERMEGG